MRLDKRVGQLGFLLEMITHLFFHKFANQRKNLNSIWKIEDDRGNMVEGFEDIVGVLPPKLYLVVFYQVRLVKQTRITCSYLRRHLEVLLGSACCTISHVHTPWGNCNKCSSVSVKDSVF